MFGYIPSRERRKIQAFYEGNYLYPMKDGINWNAINTVRTLSTSINAFRTDAYSKAMPFKALNTKSRNYVLEFPNDILYVFLADFNDVDTICKRIEKGDYKALFLNLTENYGGNVQRMLKIANLLTTKPVDLCLKYRSGEHKYHLHENPVMEAKAICVLTGKNTISSAEILAFITKEGNLNSSLKGERTYGKSEGQVTRISVKYQYMFCLTAYKWTVNGMTCGQLQEKYKDDFDDNTASLSDYLESFEVKIKDPS